MSALLQQVAATGAWTNAHPKEVSAMLTPHMALSADIVATRRRRPRYGAVPLIPAIAAKQQRVAELF